MKRSTNQFMPFILAGIAVVAFAFGIILLAYLFLFGAIIGLILFVVSWVRKNFFRKKASRSPKKRGRIIDSNDWREL